MRTIVLTVFVITSNIGLMALATKTVSKGTRPFGGIEEDTFISLCRTVDLLSRRLELVLKAAEISPTQYNVLRILRGTREGLPCGEIGSRMVSRDPDITRLLDRLEKRGLISRGRDHKDRRVIVTKITPAGLQLLAQLDEPITDAHKKQLGHLGRQRLKELGELLAEARQNAT
jgi:DNA-binding MarR family transcriptional regulator